jgi:hypothetical protein
MEAAVNAEKGTRRLALILGIACAFGGPLNGQTQTGDPKISLEIGSVTVGLGMPETDALFGFQRAGYRVFGKPSDSNKLVVSDKATADQRGTQSSPLVVDARTIHSDKETAEESKKIAEQERVNTWNIRLTAVIAVCAFLQFCGIVGQIIVYCSQSKMMEKGLKLGSQNTHAALTGARAAQSAADAFMSAERPWVLVLGKHHAFIEKGLGDEKVEHSTAGLILKNWGRSPAFIREANCGAFLCKTPSDVNESLFDALTDDGYQTGNVKQLALPPDQSDESLQVVSRDWLGESEWDAVARGKIHYLYIYCGIIRYDDPYGKGHETRFCIMPDGSKWRIAGTPKMNVCT